MATYTYNRDIPDAPNNPSVDQPDMKTNTNSIDSLINEDHYSFGVNNGGFHKQVRMPVLGAIPAGLIGGSGTIYTKTINNGAGNQAQEFYTNGASGNEYQLTRADNTNFPTFAAAQNGWTFLPGGLILQYGNAVTTGLNTDVVFPYEMTIAYSLTTTLAFNVPTSFSSLSGAGFTFSANPTANGRRFNWMVIGR